MERCIDKDRIRLHQRKDRNIFTWIEKKYVPIQKTELRRIEYGLIKLKMETISRGLKMDEFL